MNAFIIKGQDRPGSLAEVAEERLDDVSPLVRGAAVWALARLTPRKQLLSFAAERMQREADSTVIEEWRDALAAPL